MTLTKDELLYLIDEAETTAKSYEKAASYGRPAAKQEAIFWRQRAEQYRSQLQQIVAAR